MKAIAKTLAAGIALAAAVILTGCGTATTGGTTTHPPATHSQAGPIYNLEGFVSAANGPEERAFTSQLGGMGDAMTSVDVSDAHHHAVKLISAADAWLAVLDQTNPPPEYVASKTHLMKGIKLIKRAAEAADEGMSNWDPDEIYHATDLINRGGDEIQTATDALP